MTPLRFFLDEDVHGPIVPALRIAGIDAVSTPEVGRLGELDETQLEWSTSAGRVIVTFNTGDFLALHASWLQAGKSHAGIIVSAQRPIGDMVRRLLHMASMLDSNAMLDRAENFSAIGKSLTRGTNVTQTAKCVRCRQPLPEGSGFCITCGHMNENALIERQVKVMGQANDRIGFAQKFREICRGVGGWFRWS